MICTLAALEAASADGRVIPLQGLPIPRGGVAVVYGTSSVLQVGGSFCCTLIVVAPSGAIFYQPGSTVKIAGSGGRKSQDAWRRIRGTLSSRVKIDQKLARDLIKLTNSVRTPTLSAVAADVARSVSCPGGRCAETVFAIVRDGKAYKTTISRDQELAVSRLGLLPGPDGVTLAKLIPTDSVGLAYEQSLFIVRRTGAVTIQYGYMSMNATHEPLWLPASAAYNVEPISAAFAARLVDEAPHAEVPDGCPALDTLINYHLLEVVTRDHVSNSLFCYPSAPMRDELMQVVRKVYSL